MNQTKEQLIQQIMDTDDSKHTICIITVLKDFTCEFCGEDRKYKKIFSDPSLGTDVCGWHSQLVDKFREVGLSNADIREHIVSLEKIFPRR